MPCKDIVLINILMNIIAFNNVKWLAAKLCRTVQTRTRIVQPWPLT